MSLDFALFENHLTSDPNDYMAVVQNLRSKSQDEVIDLMISRGSTVTKAEALSVLEEYERAIKQMLGDGFAINTPLFNLSLSIKGVFNSPDEPFTPSKHSVQINIGTGTHLSSIGKTIAPQRIKGSMPKPDPDYLYDLGSDTRNEELTPGNIAQLKGSRLKFNADEASQGIFLIAEDGTETKVNTISRNKPAQLDFLVPALTAGKYRLVIRTIFQNTKSLRSGELPYLLAVVG